MTTNILLAPDQLRQAREAFLSAFVNATEFEQVVHLALGQSLDTIAQSGNLAARVHSVLMFANAHNQMGTLLDAACTLNPGNLDLQAFAAQFDGLNVPEVYLVRKAGDTVPLDKPVRAQHFTGRTHELATLLDTLQPGCRITLCGPGGVGKSALVAEAIAQLTSSAVSLARFPDGILHHTFQEQSEADIYETIAVAFGKDPRPNAREAARAALRNKQALLILESAENAVDLDSVVSMADSCGMLITTRRHHDAPASFQDISPLSITEGIELLRFWAGKQASDEASAEQLVRHLGGLPLAILLVGRYLAQQKQLASEYIDWLTDEGLTALEFFREDGKSIPRLMQRSLVQVSEAARAAFSVTGALAFAPFPKEVITAALALAPHATQRALGELVDYGLLIRPDVEYQVTHALAHIYARDALPPSSETLHRTTQYYLDLVDVQNERGLEGSLAIDAYRSHVLALQLACRRGEQWKSVIDLAQRLDGYLSLRGYWPERVTVHQQALEASRALGDTEAECTALGNLGLAYFWLGETRRAVKLHKEQLTIARGCGYRSEEAVALRNLGSDFLALGEPHQAIEFYEQCLAVSREIQDRRRESRALGGLGKAYSDLGNARLAINFHEQDLAITCEINDRKGEGAALGHLGLAYYTIGDIRRAIEYYEQDLAITREIGDRRGQGASLRYLGRAYIDLDESHRAIEYLEQCLAIVSDIGDRKRECNTLGDLGMAYLKLGELSTSIEYQSLCLAIAREIGSRRAEANANWGLGLAYEKRGDLRRAIESMQACLAYEAEIGHPDAKPHAEYVDSLRSRLDTAG